MRIPRIVGRWRVLMVTGYLTVGCCLLWASDMPPEIKAIQALTTWQMSHPEIKLPEARRPEESCGIKDASSYALIRLDHFADSNLDDKAATQHIRALDQKVVHLLKQRHWTAISMGPDRGGIPNLRRCYRKDGAVAQIYKTTGLCTMNTPCHAYDGFAVVFYQKKTDRRD